MKNKIQEVLHITSNTDHLSKMAILLVAFLLTAVFPFSSKAQTLGKVWDKTYGDTAGKVYNIYPNKTNNNYTAIAVETVNVGGVNRAYIGKIYEMNESGTMLRTFSVDVRDGAYLTVKPSNTNFNGVKIEGGIAFRTEDNGALAFFNVYDTNRSTADRQPDWNSESNQLRYGIWVVKLNEQGEITNQRIDRGTAILDGLQLSDGRFMVGGLDENVSSNSDARNVTLLRIYTQNGDLDKDFRGTNVSSTAVAGVGFNIREVISLHLDPKVNSTDPDVISIATILYLARISDLNDTTAPSISYPLDNVSIPGTSLKFNNPNIQSMTPTSDGGVFVESLIANNWQAGPAYTGGLALVKFESIIDGAGKPTFQPKYARTERPATTAASELKYDAPYLLPNGDYGGVVQYKVGMNGTRSSYIYELKDLGTSYEIKPTPGAPVLSGNNAWTSLDGELVVKRSSKVDGFFAVGKDVVAPNKSNIIKLSTCANFVLNNAPENGYYFVKPRAKFNLSESFTYQGASSLLQEGVKYSMTVSVLSGVVENKQAGETLYSISEYEAETYNAGSGIMMTIDDSFTVSGDQPVVQYTITTEDHYEIASAPQICQQTTVFYLAQELYGGVTKGVSYVATNSALPSALYVEDASGGFGANSYQWEEFVSGAWVAISGATAETYLPTGNLTASKQFRRVITNSLGSEPSTTFTVNVLSLADIDVVSLPTAVIEDGNLIIKTAIKNISPIASASAFKIAVYKNVAGNNSTKVTFTDSEGAITGGDTRNYTITIPNYTTDSAWSNPTQIVVSFNDNGNTNADQSFAQPQNLNDAILQIKN